MKDSAPRILYLFPILSALFGIINSPTALLLGITFTMVFDNPYKYYIHKVINYLLKIAVVGLGFGMYIKETLAIGMQSFWLTFTSIVFTVSLGFLLTKVLKIDKKLGHLITSGTAICGGSAIAAISAVIKANSNAISAALGIVFFLNSIALFVFPVIGDWLNLSQNQFGFWCAIAIHDTSSVIGAAMDYGNEALSVATTVKLSRTLWIIPLSIFSMFLFKTKGEGIKIPYFMLLFIIAITINSFHLLPTSTTAFFVLISKRLLVVTLFLIGSTISLKKPNKAIIKPIVFALILWLFISIFSLMYITY